MNKNTNIDDYSIEDLLNLLELEDPSKEEIIEKINTLNNNYFNENNEIRSFFYSAQNKLLNFLDNTTNNIFNYNLENILPHNNIIESMENIEDSLQDNNLQDNNLQDNNLQDNNLQNNNLQDNNLQDNNLQDNNLQDNNFQDNNLQDNNLQDNNLQDNNFQEASLEEAIEGNIKDKTQTSYNSFELVNIDNNVIENYEIYNYLHFNTVFRAKNNPLAQTLIPSTNSNFILSEPINNITQIKLASITIKKPFLISTLKSNNTFAIKKYNNSLACDFSAIFILDDGYYEDEEELVILINKKLNTFTSNDSSGQMFINALEFSIDPNNKKIQFDLCYNTINSNNSNNSNNINFHHYTLDFKSYYTPYYSLATILGFDYNKTDDYINSIDASNVPINNTKITSTYCYSNIGNKELFFCFDEYQQNIIETHKLFLNNNMSTFKILGKINATLGNKSNNFYINEIFTKTSRYDIIRKYDGVINLLNFNIKIIDYYGNIINTINNEDFTFSFEAKLRLRRIIQ